MKRGTLIKGCLITFAIFSLLVIILIGMFFWVILFGSEEPTTNYNIKEPFAVSEKYGLDINYNKQDILYELVMENKHPSDRAYFYKIAVKLDRDITLKNALPIKKSVRNKVNKAMLFNKISNRLDVKINKPSTSDLTFMDLKVFSRNKKQIVLPLKRGSYNCKIEDGSFRLTLYDKDAKVLYYEYHYKNY